MSQDDQEGKAPPPFVAPPGLEELPRKAHEVTADGLPSPSSSRGCCPPPEWSITTATAWMEAVPLPRRRRCRSSPGSVAS